VINKVFFAGHLGRDPELRFTSTGTAICELSIASSFRSKDGKESTTWADVVAWGPTGEAAAQYLKKGAAVLVEGRLTLDQWETPEGQKRSKLKITAERVHFLGGKTAAQGADAPAATDDREAEVPF